ncbi:SoxR reducing system RseC family protein [Reinekea marinisedimentorum]|uniref:Positive regulator of sigma E activity n=1 Tax=Reinekea marinisedimentorum TaxID=230495 RepID=A0A4R3I268_9GAMM|nr:SoxR reducing system RseC family protein [Reinekea marinisedimentorum]TCS39718.1 positive regulator of sigma E activity [Reinekea marinisedimentorum]
MASVSATIIENSNNQVKLSATRSGGCANCAQKDSCAVLWQPTESNDPITVKADGHQAVGDKVTLQCSEQALLGYIAALFLPTLLLLLLATLLTEAALPGLPLVLKVALNAVIPVALGYKVSGNLLQKHEGKFLAATKILN